MSLLGAFSVGGRAIYHTYMYMQCIIHTCQSEGRLLIHMDLRCSQASQRLVECLCLRVQAAQGETESRVQDLRSQLEEAQAAAPHSGTSLCLACTMLTCA